MPRRSRFAAAAAEWFRVAAPGNTVSTAALWASLRERHPDLTTPTERRKTPRATCMRDLRKDPAFEVSGGRVHFKGPL
jgi:hypothetical protein